jgi:hypothetical protein
MSSKLIQYLPKIRTVFSLSRVNDRSVFAWKGNGYLLGLALSSNTLR